MAFAKRYWMRNSTNEKKKHTQIQLSQNPSLQCVRINSFLNLCYALRSKFRQIKEHIYLAINAILFHVNGKGKMCTSFYMLTKRVCIRYFVHIILVVLIKLRFLLHMRCKHVSMRIAQHWHSDSLSVWIRNCIEKKRNTQTYIQNANDFNLLALHSQNHIRTLKVMKESAWRWTKRLPLFQAFHPALVH